MAVGLFSGGTTNTPSLAAGTQMLATLNATPAQLMAPGLGYAVAYPFGVVGILLTMGLLRRIFGVSPAAEAREWTAARQQATPPLATMSIEVGNGAAGGCACATSPARATGHGDQPHPPRREAARAPTPTTRCWSATWCRAWARWTASPRCATNWGSRRR